MRLMLIWPDHNLQDVRAKIFPFKRRKVEAPEVATSVALPVRRKERSLSSLVVSAPKVSTQTTTGRRTKHVQRKATALRGCSFPTEKHIKNEEYPAEDNLKNTSSPETVNKFKQNTRQNSSSIEVTRFASNNGGENGAESWNGKLDLWQPLNCLVEVANRTKSFKASSQVSNVKSESTQNRQNEPQVRRTKFKENKDKSNVEDEKNKTSAVPSDQATPKRLRRIRRRKAVKFGDSDISSQSVLDAASVKLERRTCSPVWFSLVASEDQEGDAPLPQIPTNYLRIKNGNLPVSFIQKYLMKKLDLASEAEVEIKCMGQPVLPTLLLYNLVDLWIQTISTSERVAASIGSSAKDFVMVLAYSRKNPDSE
ncbi:E3 ubiquitin protein ligase DRIP2-like isoform X2 [Euphorbia lathyris]|uniref:E3 ubiquitin protein ligase DRIP2-like isoform X2 n=1 Tax=Euphorbia lathyris TaxID=212925 RepID=UPI003314411C